MAAKSGGQISVWPQRTIRALAVANFAFGALGLALVADFPIHLDYYLRLLRQNSYQLPIFCLLAAVDFACLVVLIYTAVPLWRLHASGRLICNVLFAFELLILVVPGLVGERLLASPGTRQQLGRSIAGAFGIAGIGTAPQDIIGYPIIALVLLNLAYGRLNRRGEPRTLN